jgi:hypothetical protein
LLAVASHCTVHNSLDKPPSVQITVEPADVAPAAPAVCTSVKIIVLSV